MKALLLHQFGKKAKLLAERLRYENILCEELTLDSAYKTKEQLYESLYSKIINANAIIFYISSPEHQLPLSVLKELVHKVRMPMIVLDEKDDASTKKWVETAGVDSYIAQPFSIQSLAMKLKFLVYRKRDLDGEQFLKTGNLELDFGNHIVRKNGETIFLRNKEFALLEFLMLNSGKVLTRTTILEHVWDRNTSILSNTVDVHVTRLRKKLDGLNSKKPIIKTIYCVGYQFDASEEVKAKRKTAK